jgi:hypothetical protein
MKLAFLFLTKDNHSQGELWESFFSNLPQSLYSIYCHPKFPDQVSQPFLRNNIISRTMETKHADISLVRATLLLLAAACQDPQNDCFILLSDSCIPLYGFNQIHGVLSRSGKSFISYQFGVKNEEMTDRWRHIADPSFVAFDRFAIQHQWMALNRRLADIILQNDFTEQFENVYAADEHYIINLLVKLNLPLDEMVVNQRITFVNWQDFEEVRLKKQNPDGSEYIFRHFRPKTYEQLSTIDVVKARKFGCLFLRKVGPACDVTALTRLVRAMSSV